VLSKKKILGRASERTRNGTVQVPNGQTGQSGAIRIAGATTERRRPMGVQGLDSRQRVSAADFERMSLERRESILGDMLLMLYLGSPTTFRGPGPEAVGKKRLRAGHMMRTSQGRPGETMGIPRQRDVNAVAQLMNFDIVKTYEDADITGFTKVRFGWLDMMLDSRSGVFDVLIVEAADRIGRAESIIFEAATQLRGYGIPIFSVIDNKVLTRSDITMSAIAASQERERIQYRTNDGVNRWMHVEGKITKRLSYGHFSRYYGKNKYTTEIHPTRGPAVTRAHMLFDLGVGSTHLARLFNALGYPVPEPKSNPEEDDELSETKAKSAESLELKSEIAAPKKKNLWKAYHFSKKGGILRNEEAIGKFRMRKTRTITDPSSNKKIVTTTDESEWITVERPDLALTETDRYYRNQERFAARAFKLGSGLKVPRLQGIRNRGLLSSTIECSVCGSNFNYATRRGSRILFCGGTKQGSCTNWAEIDAPKLEAVLVEIVRQEVEHEDSLKIYAETYAATIEQQRSGFEHSRADLEKEVAKLKLSLAEALKAKSMAEGSEREVYVAEEERIRSRIREIDFEIATYESARSAAPHLTARVTAAKDVFARLASPDVLKSGNWMDAETILTFRNCIKTAKFEPNSHDYAATIRLTMSYEHFFPEKPKTAPDLDSRYEIHIPGRRNTSHTPRRESLKNEIIRDPERHRITDEEWKAVRSVLEPLTGAIAVGYLRRNWTNRELWDGILIRLKAGLGPASKRLQISNQTIVSLAARHLKLIGKWSAVFSALESTGSKWVGNINPDMRKFLSEPIAPHNDVWTRKRIS
jgi:site-specific DNA recombinase